MDRKDSSGNVWHGLSTWKGNHEMGYTHQNWVRHPGAWWHIQVCSCSLGSPPPPPPLVLLLHSVAHQQQHPPAQRLHTMMQVPSHASDTFTLQAGHLAISVGTPTNALHVNLLPWTSPQHYIPRKLHCIQTVFVVNKQPSLEYTHWDSRSVKVLMSSH
jgi:hypothetical protein